MLCVTITIVTWFSSSAMVSSIRLVEVGSSAEHGSSMSITSGETASARAMHSRCCWPPERPPPGARNRASAISAGSRTRKPVWCRGLALAPHQSVDLLG